jgi:ferric enterobactin receptor
MRSRFRLFLLCMMMLPVLWGQAQQSVVQNLEEALVRAAAQEGIMLAYDPSRLKNLPAPDVYPEGTSLEKLQKLLRPYGLTAEWVRPPKAVIIDLPPGIQGKVVDAETRTALPFATIQHLGGASVLSDERGYFEIQVKGSQSQTIIVSYLGYVKDTLVLKPRKAHRYRIDLNADAHMLEEVTIEDGLKQNLRVSESASQASINPKMISRLSGLGEPDIFRASQLLPGVQEAGLSSGGLQIRGGSPDQTLTRFDGITAYRVDHFFGLFGAFNSRAVRTVDVYRGGFGAQFGGRTSGVIDIEGRNGNFNKPHFEVGLNLFNTSALLEAPIIKDKLSILIAGRQSYSDVVESPFYKRFFSSVFAPPEDVAMESEREVRRSGSNSEDFISSYEHFRFDPQSITNLAGGSSNGQLLTRSPIDFRTVNRDYLREEAESSFEFSDLHVRLAARPSKRDLITLSLFAGSDFLGYSYNDSPGNALAVGIQDELKLTNRGSSLRWKRQWNEAFSSHTTFAYSEHNNNYQYRITATDDSTSVATQLNQHHTIRDFSIRSDHKAKLSEENTIKMGFEMNRINLRYGMGAGDTLFLGQKNAEEVVAWYAENEMNPIPALTITLGMRNSWFSRSSAWYPEPRIKLRYTPRSPWRLKAAWGMYNQFLSRIQVNNGLGLGEDFFAFGGDDLIPVVSSTHSILGAAWEKDSWLIDVEAYRKATTGLITYALRSDLLEIDPEGNGELLSGGESMITGLDVLVQKTTGKHTGWLSYSLGHGWQRFPGIAKGSRFPTMQDQRHEIKLVNQVKLKSWEFAATWILASGLPYTEATDSRTVLSPDSNTEIYELVIGERNAARLPAYHRLDLSATRHFTLGKSKAEAGISIYNAYFRRNIRQRRYVLISPSISGLSPRVSQADIYDLGISPNIFLKLRF